MPWHLSKSDPRKVYDERHETVCVCQTPEQAARIVAAMAGNPQPGQPIKLREPEAPRPIHVCRAEGCCGLNFAKFCFTGALNDAQQWECPKCGTLYKPEQRGAVTNWEALSDVMLIGRRS